MLICGELLSSLLCLCFCSVNGVLEDVNTLWSYTWCFDIDPAGIPPYNDLHLAF